MAPVKTHMKPEMKHQSNERRTTIDQHTKDVDVQRTDLILLFDELRCRTSRY